MLPALVLGVAAVVLITAGFENRNVLDVILGLKTERDTGGPEFSETGGPILPDTPTLTGSLQQAISGLGEFDGKQVAGWIIPVLTWARKHGWHGQVTSGYRTTADQARVCATGVKPCATPGQSNHQGKRYPRGAVDVSDWETLRTLAPHYPGPGPTLHWGGQVIGDNVHFSATGH